MNKIVKGIYDVLLENEFKGTKILYVGEGECMIKCILLLPPKKDSSQLREILENLKEQINALDVKISKQEGKKIEILFGKCDLNKVPFKIKMINKNSLKITFMSAFGECQVDFMDGASCHMLNGGRTRMGKTTFVLYMLTSLYFQMKGKIKLYICSSKESDFFPFQNLPNVEFATDKDEMIQILSHVIEEYEDRRKLLKTTDLYECVDAKGVKKQRPDKYYLFQPIFLLIDEYADYSKIPDIQDSIKTIVRKAGYVNIHVIVCTQRADARFTIPPDVKANLGATLCFTTKDKANSLNILDMEGAEKLGSIEGRAILLDGEKTIIQVPHMNYKQIKRMLKPFKRGIQNDYQRPIDENPTRSTHTGISEKVQNMFKKSAVPSPIQEQRQPNQHLQHSNEATRTGWFLL